jgi:hypothetical protein
MAIGRIPLLEHTGSAAGVVVYSGTVARGVWSYEPPPRANERRADALTARVDKAKRVFNYLRDVDFVGERFTMTPGWVGWWGVLRAFELALPTVGLRVDDRRVEHVRAEEPSDTPADYIEAIDDSGEPAP